MLVPSHSLYKELKVPQGTGRIFFRFATENLHPFRFALSLQNFFRLVCFSGQAEGQKAMQWFSAWTSNYTSRTARSFVPYLLLFAITLRFKPWGLVPTRRASTPNKKQWASEVQWRGTCRAIVLVIKTDYHSAHF